MKVDLPQKTIITLLAALSEIAANPKEGGLTTGVCVDARKELVHATLADTSPPDPTAHQLYKDWLEIFERPDL